MKKFNLVIVLFLFLTGNLFGQEENECILRGRGTVILINKEKKGASSYSNYTFSDLVFLENVVNFKLDAQINVDSILNIENGKFIVTERKNVDLLNSESNFQYAFIDSLLSSDVVLTKSGFKLYSLNIELYYRTLKLSTLEYAKRKSSSTGGTNVSNSNKIMNCLMVLFGIKI